MSDQLINAEVLEAWKRLENSLVSMAAVGLQVSHDAASETEAACSAAQVGCLLSAPLCFVRRGSTPQL